MGLADALEELVALHDALRLAAAIVEPMSGFTGVLPSPKKYLQAHVCCVTSAISWWSLMKCLRGLGVWVFGEDTWQCASRFVSTTGEITKFFELTA